MQNEGKDNAKRPYKKGLLIRFLERFSENSEVKPFASEWSTGIVLLWIFTCVTMCVSMVSAYSWFYNHTYALITNQTAAVSIAITLDCGIEFFTNYLCFKAVKFAIKMKEEYATAIPVLLLAAVFYSFSFYNSTQGAALLASSMADQTTALNDNYKEEVARLKAVEAEDEQQIRSLIKAEKENPQGWNNSKRNSIITESQLRSIQKYNNQISDYRKELNKQIEQLRKDKADKISLNEAEVSEKSAQYWAAMAILLILQLVSNALIQFSSDRIRLTKTNTPMISAAKLQQVKQNAVTTILRSVVNEVTDHVKTISNTKVTEIDLEKIEKDVMVEEDKKEMVEVVDEITHQVSSSVTPTETKITTVSQIQSTQAEPKKEEAVLEEVTASYRQTGFRNDWREPATASQENQPKPATPTLQSQGILVRHSTVVRAIQQVVPADQLAGISNEQCEKVSTILKEWNYPYNSRSTIQNVDKARKSHQII